MRHRGAIGLAIAGSMLFSSTGAIAAANAPAPPQVDPWAVLSVMNGGASAAAVCGLAAAATTAAQPAAGCVLPQIDTAAPVAQAGPPAPIPTPPVEGPAAGVGISPLLLGLLAIAAAAGLYFALRHHHHHHANSPA